MVKSSTTSGQLDIWKNAIEKAHYSQTYPHGRGIWWPRAVSCKVIMKLGNCLAQADIQSDVPPSRGIWRPRAVVCKVIMTLGYALGHTDI